MQTERQKFKDYLSWLIKNNQLDKNKLADLRKNSESAFREWQSTKEIWTNYLINKPKITKSKIETPKIDDIKKDEFPTWRLWQNSASNSMTEKLEDSIWAYEKEATKWASKKETILRDDATEQTDIIKERDLWKRARTDEESELTKKKFDMEETNAARAREDASAVFKRQEDIANRQAQIAWAWLWQWWLQLSEATMQDFKDSIIAKYGENISNAEQFKTKTNREVDDVLSKNFWDLFNNTQEINLVKNALDDAQYAPVLNALEKAAEWNTQAIDDVTTFAKWIIGLNTEEKRGRFAKEEKIADRENAWVNADNAKKAALLKEEFTEIPMLDAYIWNPEKFNNKTYQEAVDIIQKEIATKWNLANIIAIQQQYVAAQKEVPWYITDIIEQMSKDYEISKSRTDRHSEVKEESRKDTFWSDSMTNTIWWTETSQTFDINKYAKTLDKYISKKWKDKILQLLKDRYETRKVKKNVYDWLVEYINKK